MFRKERKMALESDHCESS